jgi:hypothetical protein
MGFMVEDPKDLHGEITVTEITVTVYSMVPFGKLR